MNQSFPGGAYGRLPRGAQGGDHGAGELAGDLLAAGGTVVSDMHDGIAGRQFGALGNAARPVQILHDGVASGVYKTVRLGLRAARGAHAAALRAADDAPSRPPRGSVALGALNGFLGDRLAARGSELALPMTIRRDPDDAPGPRIAVFVHGLCETDAAWRLMEPSYGDRLRDEPA